MKEQEQHIMQDSFLTSEDGLLGYQRELLEVMSSSPAADDNIGDRCYSLSGGRVVFGVCLAETVDSFVVGLPAILVSDGSVVKGKALVNQPIVRIPKPGVVFTTTAIPDHRYLYYQFLKSRTGRLPGFFNETRMRKIAEVLDAGISESFKPPSQEDVNDDDDDSPGSGEAKYSPYNKRTRH